MGGSGHVPVRMCAVCRRRLPKHVLTRFVRSKTDEALMLDTHKILQGRGVYVCADPKCIDDFGKAGKRRGRRKEKACDGTSL